jgi:hypothetical protein
MSLIAPPARFSFATPFVIPIPSTPRVPRLRDDVPTLSINLPHQQYGTVKTVTIPFDHRISNGGRFNTLGDAVTFISKHCLFHHGAFSKTLLRTYLPYCRLLNLARGEYVPLAHVSNRELDREFRLASQLT